jgi:hypothetical protein
MTLTETPAAVDAAQLRYTAMLAISMSFTPGELRTRSEGTQQEAADKQIADEIEFLSACGYTEQVASTVLTERARAIPHTPRGTEEDARREIRTVAEVFLQQLGPEAVALCHRIADTAAKRGDDTMVRSFLDFAEAAEQLLAERAAESSA